jgi:hypothetical protein
MTNDSNLAHNRPGIVRTADPNEPYLARDGAERGLPRGEWSNSRLSQLPHNKQDIFLDCGGCGSINMVIEWVDTDTSEVLTKDARWGASVTLQMRCLDCGECPQLTIMQDRDFFENGERPIIRIEHDL